jgi:hypothetical protein
LTAESTADTIGHNTVAKGEPVMIERIMRILKLDFSVFREIESDPNATTEAAIVVAITTLVSAIASAVGSDHAVASFVQAMINGFVGWIVWSAVTYFVGRSMFAGGGTLVQMLRVLGYANAPRILSVFAVIPCFGWLGVLIGWLLSIVAGIMAIKEALDLELGTAIAVVIIGVIAMVVFWAIVGVIVGSVFAITFGLSQLLFGR